MSSAWMIRSGSRGAYLDLFETGVVGIGFDVQQDLSGTQTLDDMRKIYAKHQPDVQKNVAAAAAGMLDKLVRVIQVGDGVISYDPETRSYLVGKISGPYYYEASDANPIRHRRKVTWETKRVSRDDLLQATRNSLGSLLALFQLNVETWADIQKVLKGGKSDTPSSLENGDTTEAELDQSKRSLQEQAHERLKDRIVLLDDSDMQEMLAAVLRGMGFRTTVSPTGPDRGVDILASPDGLGLQEPCIKCEVKHRKKTQMGAPEIRSFIGGLRAGDKGLYLSTGGFTKEARYEAERSAIPLKLVDLDDLALLIETHYDNFDAEGRALLPLTRIYWPAD